MTTQQHGLVPVFTMGDRFRKARELTGLDQRAFAERLGVSQQTIVNAEKGHTKTRKITINAWAMVTGVSAQWLATGVGPHADDDGLPRLDSNQEPSVYRRLVAA